MGLDGGGGWLLGLAHRQSLFGGVVRASMTRVTPATHRVNMQMPASGHVAAYVVEIITDAAASLDWYWSAFFKTLWGKGSLAEALWVTISVVRGAGGTAVDRPQV